MFVDQSGRRGRILTVTAIGSGAVVVTLLAFVITGMLGGTELPGLSWPGKAPDRPAGGGTAFQSPTGSPTRAPRVGPSATPTPVPQAPVSSPSQSPLQTPATTPPANKPSKTPPATPGGSTTDRPGHGGTPPGQVGKTHGPK
ncbi:hypothetical protein Pmi06nite_31450 [Planotetraspora mira]|uniref:Uncharacterized protein n=1 Tax=Planotetraspora mira TaxID=58121 RepID=A0A8J3XAN5_9ACTN|nr:hypothetical protein Pmi06nite_31450 [Planotetraspora mira]